MEEGQPVAWVGAAQQHEIRVEDARCKVRLNRVTRRVDGYRSGDGSHLFQQHIAVPRAARVQHGSAVRIEGAEYLALARQHRVVARTDRNVVRAEAADDLIAAVAVGDGVISGLSEYPVHAVPAHNGIVPADKFVVSRDLTDDVSESRRIG